MVHVDDTNDVSQTKSEQHIFFYRNITKNTNYVQINHEIHESVFL